MIYCYTYHVSILGELCVLFLDGSPFLLVPYMSKFLSSHATFLDQMLISGDNCDLFYVDLGSLHRDLLIDYKVVGLGLDCALLNVLHSKCKEILLSIVIYYLSLTLL